ncbi:MAG: glycine cleavage system aminomethyltransferase GcvT [Deltaproteobacteria bacterium]
MSEIKTPLFDRHVEAGAKMVSFAGYMMPINYETSIQEEHLFVRNNVGIFDVSHMGEFFVEGPDALKLIQSISSNDASKLKIGQAQYSCMPNDKGGIVDDLLIYRSGEEKFMMVVNAANLQKDWDWLVNHNKYNVKATNGSDNMGILAVQGPNAHVLVQKLTDTDLSRIEYYHFETGTVAGIENIIISATGYTGAGGFELYINNGDLVHIWDALFNAGKDMDVKPVGLGARDTLRLEMGFCLYGNDIDDTTSPIEAGLKWITKLDKPDDFPSKEKFIDQHKNGVDKMLVGFVMEGKRIPRHEYPVLNDSGDAIGVVTSGTFSPSLEIPIGMAYVKKEYAKPGTIIQIDFSRKTIPAEVVKIPFYKK